MAELQGMEGIPGLSDEFNNFIIMMRLWMRDEPHLNRLIRGVESSNRLIAWAAMDFLSDFNSTPPPLGNFTLEQLLSLGYTNLARYGTAVALTESLEQLQTRNHLNFSDGGINVAISDKTPQLQARLRYYENKYEQNKLKIKVSLNINSIMGEAGAFSEYYLVNGFYGPIV
jgi:hypothetical protein